MNELFRIIGIAVVGGIMAVLLRSYNPIFGMLSAIMCTVVAAILLLDTMSEVIGEVRSIIESGGLDNTYIKTVIKVVGIAYLTQFGADMLRDSGESAIAAKCELAGKVFILYLTMPVISDFLKICIQAAEGI